MKYAPLLYAKALADAILGAAHTTDEEKILKNFLNVVRKNGDERELRKIVGIAEKFIVQNSGGKLVEVTTAREVKRPTELLKTIVDPQDVLRETIDPNIVSGIKITVNDEREFDATLTKKLNALFNTK